jgi:hypothetical protein
MNVIISVQQEIQEIMPAALERFLSEPIDDKTLNDVRNTVDAIMI